MQIWKEENQTWQFPSEDDLWKLPIGLKGNCISDWDHYYCHMVLFNHSIAMLKIKTLLVVYSILSIKLIIFCECTRCMLSVRVPQLYLFPCLHLRVCFCVLSNIMWWHNKHWCAAIRKVYIISEKKENTRTHRKMLCQHIVMWQIMYFVWTEITQIKC